eukprot:472151-Pleurochrysis_carterae.AAC.4
MGACIGAYECACRRGSTHACARMSACMNITSVSACTDSKAASSNGYKRSRTDAATLGVCFQEAMVRRRV